MSKALIVEDSADFQMIFQAVLEGLGYTTQSAYDGEAATAILYQETFDLAIFDLQMPKRSGISVLREVRSQPRHDNMRVIVVTANPHMISAEADALDCYVMMKPFDVTKLSEFIRRLDIKPVKD
jgi:CheY-like chemotaxis protein